MSLMNMHTFEVIEYVMMLVTLGGDGRCPR